MQEVAYGQDSSIELHPSLWGAGHMLQPHGLAGSEDFKVVHMGG